MTPNTFANLGLYLCGVVLLFGALLLHVDSRTRGAKWATLAGLLTLAWPLWDLYKLIAEGGA